MTALPVVCHCARVHPGLPVLLTTTTLSSFQVIQNLLPDGVIYQVCLQIARIAAEPCGYSEVIQNLARMQICSSSLSRGNRQIYRTLEAKSGTSHDCSGSLECTNVIEFFQPLVSTCRAASTIQAVHFRLLHTPPGIIHFAGDLKYTVDDVGFGDNEASTVKDLQQQFSNRPVWMAASIHRGGEEVILQVHDELIKLYPTLLLIIVPGHPEDSKTVSTALEKRKVDFIVRTSREVLSSNTIVDTLGSLL